MYDIRIRENSLFGVNAIISFYICQPSCVSLLKPRQKNLSDPEAYPEPCQTSNMDYFVKIVNGLNLLTFFVRHSILDV